MKKLLLFSFGVLISAMVSAQNDYTITGAGTGKNGHYLVNVKVNVKKVKMKTEDIVIQSAVDGVMFNGFMTLDGAVDQAPLISDLGIKDAKADFFKSFNDNGDYRRFASIVPGTLSIMKNKQLKCNEVSASVLVNQQTLRKFLEESGIISGFSNLF